MNNNPRAAIVFIVFLSVFFVFGSMFFVIAGDFSIGIMPMFIMPIFIFVFLAIVMTLRIKKTANQVIDRAMSDIETTNTCPNCGSKLLPNAEFCHRCGASIETTVICDYCGTKNKKGELQCRSCNALL